jgi:hypothetical protein
MGTSAERDLAHRIPHARSGCASQGQEHREPQQLTSIFSKYTLMLVRTIPLTTVLTARLARDVMSTIHGAGIATETPSSRLHRHPVLPVDVLALLVSEAAFGHRLIFFWLCT